MICDLIDDLATQSHSALIILHMLGVIFFHLNSPSLSKAINSLVLKRPTCLFLTYCLHSYLLAKDENVQGGDKTSHGNAGGLLSVAA
jgi:hypothetical protein